jgi:hypothetical protein
MHSRTLYFLKDSITDKFYVNARTLLGEFENAVIHTTKNSVLSGVKYRIRIYKFQAKAGEDKTINNVPHIKKSASVARNRLKRFDCAIEIIPINISL